MAKRPIFLLVFIFLLAALPALAEEPGNGKKEGNAPPGPPPALVVTAPAAMGAMAPQELYVGTVAYPEVAQVASEVDGKVESVKFEEGDRVKAGAVLVVLNADILKKNLDAARAQLEALKTELERSRIEEGRIQSLLEKESVAQSRFDDVHYKVLATESRLAALEARVEELSVSLSKKTVKAPFGGVILERNVDAGEWVNPGSPLCSLAKDEFVDVVVSVPAEVARSVAPGFTLTVNVAGKEAGGKVQAVIPKGDVSTRTFPVKIRMPNPGGAMSGMEAGVRLPAGPPSQTLLVPRDAVISSMGQIVVWAVFEGKAVPMPVTVTGYQGLQAGVSSDKLFPGAKVVIKGNERLRPGQDVTEKPGEEAKAPEK